jgi:hypothetical protein
VGLSLVRFPNGGSWSFFVCPIGPRLYDGGLACRGCLKARGLRFRVELFSHASKRTAWTAPRRLARLNSTEPARLHPRRGRMLDGRASWSSRSSAALLSSAGPPSSSLRRMRASYDCEQLCR